MSDALTKALIERERILQRVARQRESVVIAFSGLSRPAAVIDRLIAAGRVLRAHPAALALIAAGLVVLRGRTVIGLVGRGIGVWRLVHRIRSLIKRIPR